MSKLVLEVKNSTAVELNFAIQRTIVSKFALEITESTVSELLGYLSSTRCCLSPTSSILSSYHRETHRVRISPKHHQEDFVQLFFDIEKTIVFRSRSSMGGF